MVKYNADLQRCGAEELVNAGSATGGTLQYKLGGGSYSDTIPTATKAGNYTVYYKVVGGTNYNNVAEQSVSVTIGTASMNVSASGYSGTYDGVAHGITITVPDGATVKYGTTSSGCTQTSSPAYKDAGTYTIYYQVTKTNYATVTGSATVKITKKAVKVSGITAQDKTYDGYKTATLDTSGASFDGIVIGDTLTVSAATGTFSDAWAGSGKTVNISGLTLGGGSVGNYQLAPSGQQETATASITPKAVTVTANSQTVSLNGSIAAGAGQATMTGALTNHILAEITLTGSGTSSATNSGTITPSAAKIISNNSGGLDVTTNYAITYVKGALTVTKGTLTVTAPAVKSLTYNGEEQPLVSAGSATGGTILYSLTQKGAYGENVPTGKDAGDYTVWYKVDGGSDYNDVAAQSVDVAIDGKEINLTWANMSFTYDGRPHVPTATVTGFVGGDTCAVTVTGEQTNAGTYTATATGLSNGNYKLPGTAPTTGFTIDKAPLTITADDKSVTYGDAVPAYTASFSGLQGGDSITPTFSCEYAATSGVGTYPITPSAASENYEITCVSGTLTVEPKEIGIEWGGPAFTYDGTERTVALTGLPDGVSVVSYSGNSATDAGSYTAFAVLTYTDMENYITPTMGTCDWTISPKDITGAAVTLGGELTYTGAAQTKSVQSVVIDALSATYDVAGNAATNAGDYTLTVEGTGNFTGEQTAPWSIAEAALTITADNVTVTKGDEPTYSASYEGFMPGDDATVVSGLSYGCDYPATNPAPGTYVITPQGASATNYAIAYVPGTLTVKDTYAVTYYRNFAAGDSEITETQTKVEDSDLTLSLPAVARTGYAFGGWFDARSGGTQRTEASYTDNAALDLYAHWTANAYTVRFDANGGAGEMDDLAFTYDAPQTLTANAFTRSAYNFVGWARTESGAVEWNDGATVQNLTAEEDGAFTLYAVWTAEPVYTVRGTVVGSDHTAIGNVTVKLMRGNEEIASTITATDGMYVFNAPEDVYNIVATGQKLSLLFFSQ